MFRNAWVVKGQSWKMKYAPGVLIRKDFVIQNGNKKIRTAKS